MLLAFYRLLIFFFKITIFEKFFQNTIRMSNSLDSDQARINVGPDLVPNCLQIISADDTSRQRDKDHKTILGNLLQLDYSMFFFC